MNKTYFITAFFFSLMTGACAQSDLDNVLTDLLFILDRYTEPAAKVGTMQTGAGYYTSGKTMNKFSLDIALGTGILPFPGKDRNFEIDQSQLLNFQIRGASSADIPTALGGQRRVFFDFNIDDDQYEFQALSGLEAEFSAFPYVQGQLGLWKQTEVIFRVGPQITIENSSYSVFGAGVKHGLSQYIWKGEPSIDIAVMGNFNWSDFNLSYGNIELRPDDGAPPIAELTGSLLDFYSINAGFIASKDYGNWTYSSALFYNTSWIDYELQGSKSQFLDVFNQVLGSLSEQKRSITFDIGAAYNWNRWTFGSQINISRFVNFNIQGVYSVF